MLIYVAVWDEIYIDAPLQVPMTALGVVLMDKSGRRPLLLVRIEGWTRVSILLWGHSCVSVEAKMLTIQVSAGGTCLGCLLVGLSFFFQVCLLLKI